MLDLGERLVPRHGDEFGATAHERRAQAIGIFVQVFQRDRLRADVAVAEDVGLVTADGRDVIVEALMARFGVGREGIGATYTMYSLAAIPTVFIGGWLVDRLGTRRASLVFSTLVTTGAIIVALAPNIAVLYIGRLVFGMGSESLIVAQSAILARWFTGKELALSFGIALTAVLALPVAFVSALAAWSAPGLRADGEYEPFQLRRFTIFTSLFALAMLVAEAFDVLELTAQALPVHPG